MTTTRLRTLGLSVPVSEVLDPAKWKARYAHGIALGAEAQSTLITSLCSVRGLNDADARAAAAAEVTTVVDEISDDVIRWHLRAALSELEIKLGMPMGVVICKADPAPHSTLESEGLIQGVHYDRKVPRLPYTHGEGRNWYSLPAPSGVISVERVRAFYYGQLIWEFSAARENIDQVRLEHPTQGAIHLLPINFQAMIVLGEGSGNYGVWHTLGLHRSPVPDFWALDYTLGPQDRQTGQPGHIEAVLAHWVYCVAGMTILSMAGLAKSQGLTSTSVSFDGFSKSIGLQASAIYGLNSALEHVLENATKRIDWKQIKRAKKGLRIRPFSH